MKIKLSLILALVLVFCHSKIVIADDVYPMYYSYSQTTDDCEYDWTTTTTHWSNGTATSTTALASYECMACFLMGMCAVS